MRLWHYRLIPFLPKSQLLAQWRELNAIFEKQSNHILINYVYEYPKEKLKHYSDLVIDEMVKRGYENNLILGYIYYFGSLPSVNLGNANPFPNHHDNRYLLQCFYNLQEKYDRGQKDFSDEEYERLEEYVKETEVLK